MSILITKYILVKSGHFSLMYYFGWNQFLFSGRNWLFKNLFIYFNWRVITLYIVLDLAIPWHESAVGVHVFSILNPLPTPSHPIPQGHPSAPALSTLSHARTLDWQSISVLMRWMKLEPLIQSVVSQKEKTPIQYINTYIWNLERW